jgi:hypothetical protein
LKKLAFILILLSFWTINLFGCDCKTLNPISKEDYNKAACIFVGRVIKIEEDEKNYSKAITFEIIHRLKNTEQINEITIWTALNSSACGLEVGSGENWYIFAHKDEDNKLIAGLCGRSVNLEKKYKGKKYGLMYKLSEKRDWKRKYKRYKKEVRFIKKMTSNL